MNQFTERNGVAQVKRNRWITTIFVIVIFLFGTLSALKGDTGSVTAQVDAANGMLGVLGTYGNACFIELAEIDEMRLVNDLDTGSMLEGEQSKNTYSGMFRNDEFGEFIFHAYIDRAPYIVIHHGEGEVLVFNQARERITRDIYEDLQEACGK